MILVFAGAGASAAIDPKKYPTTIEFYNQLPSSLKINPFLGQVCDFLDANKRTHDVEEVLWELDVLESDISKINTPERFTTFFLKSPRMSKILDEWGGGNSSQVSKFLSLGRFIQGTIIELRDSIRVKVHDFYHAQATVKELSAWTELLKGLSKMDPHIEIFTTNYDLVLEVVIDISGVSADLGRITDLWGTKLQIDNWRGDKTRNTGLLTKLHGSVNWHWHNKEEVWISPVSMGHLNKHAILYPGYKGTPKEPFKSFYEHLERCIRASKSSYFYWV